MSIATTVKLTKVRGHIRDVEGGLGRFIFRRLLFFNLRQTIGNNVTNMILGPGRISRDLQKWITSIYFCKLLIDKPL